MKIFSIPVYNLNNQGKNKIRSYQNSPAQTSPAFKSTDSGYYLEPDQFVSIRSWAFDIDLDWVKLANCMKAQFKNKDRVNVYAIACGDGSEAFSLALMLMENDDKKGTNKKFFPIYASDRCNANTQLTQQGYINLREPEDIDRMYYDCKLGKKWEEYFVKEKLRLPIRVEGSFLEPDSIHSWYTYEMSPKLREKVKFFPGELLQDMLPRIKDDSNTVILCRNVFRYLSKEDTDMIVDFAKNELKSGSFFVIGRQDNDFSDIGKRLIDIGFKPIMPSKAHMDILVRKHIKPVIFQKI